jgi:hypothetical protein
MAVMRRAALRPAKVFFLAGYVNLLWDTARSFFNSRIPFILAAILVTVGFLLVRFGSKHDDESKQSIALPLLLAPALFLALSLPYLIAGLRPAAENFYESRHLLMFGIPLALCVLAVKRLAEVTLGCCLPGDLRDRLNLVYRHAVERLYFLAGEGPEAGIPS